MPFLRDTMQQIIDARSGSELLLPRYDKSLRGGRGDRGDPASWTRAEGRMHVECISRNGHYILSCVYFLYVCIGPVDVVLFEGWMLGFQPVSEHEAESLHPHLRVYIFIFPSADSALFWEFSIMRCYSFGGGA